MDIINNIQINNNFDKSNETNDLDDDNVYKSHVHTIEYYEKVVRSIINIKKIKTVVLMGNMFHNNNKCGQSILNNEKYAKTLGSRFIINQKVIDIIQNKVL